VAGDTGAATKNNPVSVAAVVPVGVKNARHETGSYAGATTAVATVIRHRYGAS
jgi:hypothetical protein